MTCGGRCRLERVEQRLRGKRLVDDERQVAAHDRLPRDTRRPTGTVPRVSGSRSSLEHDGRRGRSKRRTRRGMQLADPAGRLAVDRRRARERPGCSAGCATRSVVSRRGRGQRLEVALDVEEVDVARRLRPIARAARRPNAEPADAQRLLVSGASSRRKTRPSSKMRTRARLRLTLVRSVSTSPGSSDVRITSRCAAIGFSTAIGFAAGSSAASVCRRHEAERDDLLPVEVDQRALDRERRRARLRIGQHVRDVRARRGGNRCRSRGCARPPRRSLPRSRGRSGTTAASR